MADPKQRPPATKFDIFDLSNKERFAPWFMRKKDRLNQLAAEVARASRTEAERLQQEDLTAHINDMLEILSDIKLEVCEYQTKANEYYIDALSIMTGDELALKWTDKKKTALDYCKNLNCNEKRIHDRLEQMNHTIEFRVSIFQSMLKSLKP